MLDHNPMFNLITVSLKEFKLATKVFTRKRINLGPVMMAFEGGFLSFESGPVTAVMHAQGQWHGRAIFSPEIMRALATVPPPIDPVPISYANGHLLIGHLNIICDWSLPSKTTIHDLENPSIIDLLALERSIHRSEYKGGALGKKIQSAQQKTELRIKKAMSYLSDLEIEESQIRALVEERIALRSSHSEE